jgi:hypothetical protein
MIVIPLIFLIVYVTLTAVFTGRKRTAIALACLACACAFGVSFIGEGFVAENEYAKYASSIAVEGMERASRSFTDSIVVTLHQSGWLGDGLGTVTQGRQYMGVVTEGKDWQEDGVGRMFKELGIPGVLCMIASALFLLGSIRGALDNIPPRHPAGGLQHGFCGIVAANLASFIVSHQAYSGDPSTVLILGFCLGIILGLPRPVWSEHRLATQIAARPVPYPVLESAVV